MKRRKLADLTSGVGALVLGVGLGALFPNWFGPAAVMITGTGVVLHAVGMWDKHRQESSTERQLWWVGALYWLCWGLLCAVVVWVVVRR